MKFVHHHPTFFFFTLWLQGPNYSLPLHTLESKQSSKIQQCRSMLTVHTCIADLPVTHTPTVSAFTGTLRIINLCRRQAELWENHHSDISLTSLSPHYALALRLGKTLTTDFRICRPRAMKPKQVPLLNLINGHKYCSCTVSYFFTPIRHRFSPSCIVGGSSFKSTTGPAT